MNSSIKIRPLHTHQIWFPFYLRTPASLPCKGASSHWEPDPMFVTVSCCMKSWAHFLTTDPLQSPSWIKHEKCYDTVCSGVHYFSHWTTAFKHTQTQHGSIFLWAKVLYMLIKPTLEPLPLHHSPTLSPKCDLSMEAQFVFMWKDWIFKLSKSQHNYSFMSGGFRQHYKAIKSVEL